MRKQSIKYTIIVVALLTSIAMIISCGSDSTTGPDNGNTDQEDTISGHILLKIDAYYPDLSTKVSYGDTSFTIKCDNIGYFSFPAPETDQQITITPTPVIKQNAFIPSTITFTGKPENDILFFEVGSGVDETQIVGAVLDDDGTPVTNTPIDITTSQNSITLNTLDNGLFHYLLPESDSVTVVPADDARFIFSPDSYTFDRLSAGDASICFFRATPTENLYSIHGTISNFTDGSWIAIIVKINGTSHIITSDSFTLDHFLPGNYTMTLEYSGEVYETRDITITDSDVYLDDLERPYTGPTEHTVTGRVIADNGDDIENVNILYYLFKGYQYTPDITTTEISQTGDYECTCLSGDGIRAEYHIIPQHEGYTFEPDTLSVIIPYMFNTQYGGVIQVPDIVATKYTVYQPDSFFPIAESNKWTFAVTDEQDNEYDLEMAIDGTETAGGETYSQFTKAGPGGMTLLRIDGGEVHAWDGNEDIVMLRFGVVPGTEWDSGTDSAGYTRTGVFHGLEDMTVQAGTFTDCLRYESRLNYGETTYEAHEMWFAEDIGLVRQVRTLVNYGEEIERTEMELVSYSGR